MINPMELLKFKERFDKFNADHPKFVPFFRMAGKKALKEGTVMEVKFTTPEGEEYVSNIRINNDDIETLGMLMSAGANQ